MANLDLDGEGASGIADFISAAGSSVVRIALLFGSAAIALTIILTPMAENQVARSNIAPVGVDTISTGSIRSTTRSATGSREYTIRRSVLQGPGEICIINANGMRNGSC
jgi:hypothetical protein